MIECLLGKCRGRWRRDRSSARHTRRQKHDSRDSVATDLAPRRADGSLKIIVELSKRSLAGRWQRGQSTNGVDSGGALCADCLDGQTLLTS